ncbi:uncharacterized protein [Ptychodera flava]|uniref:uncharacterized protein n=1 Tax=Ptychodera flava TaxID=63121 RepID=UPI00396A27C7
MAEQSPTRIAEAVSKCSDVYDIMLKIEQRDALESFCGGRDVFAILPTGYGKSMIYTLAPKVMDTLKDCSGSIVLVISPLIALMKIKCRSAAKWNGVRTKEQIVRGKFQVVFSSPEAIMTREWRRLLSSDVYQENLVGIAIDEAHCVYQWGHDFRREYARLKELRSIASKVPILALTATAPPKFRSVIINHLGMTDIQVIEAVLNRPNIFYAVKESNDITQSFRWLIDDIREQSEKTQKSIVYCRSIKSCGTLYRHFLNELGSRAYINNEKCHYRVVRVVFAAVAFGMGVDVADVSLVIHWGAARSFDGFCQESGRAGRKASIQAYSIIYFHGNNISTKSTDTAICNNTVN